jgi:hypothetical protein
MGCHSLLNRFSPSAYKALFFCILQAKTDSIPIIYPHLPQRQRLTTNCRIHNAPHRQSCSPPTSACRYGTRDLALADTRAMPSQDCQVRRPWPGLGRTMPGDVGHCPGQSVTQIKRGVSVAIRPTSHRSQAKPLLCFGPYLAQTPSCHCESPRRNETQLLPQTEGILLLRGPVLPARH